MVHTLNGTACAISRTLVFLFEHYQQALRLRPDSAEARSSLAAVYIEKNQLDEAIKESSAALRLNPRHAEAHNNLGTAYLRKGLLDKATEHYRQALELQPGYRDAEANLAAALKLKAQNQK